MIQRIQSLYLTLAAGLLAGHFAIPFFQGDIALSSAVMSDGVYNVWDNIGLMGLSALGALVTLFAVMLYRNRPLQIRLASTAMMVSLFLILLGSYTAWRTLGELPSDYAVQWRAGFALAPMAMVLQWLGVRGIRSDELLVRSMDRLR